MNPASSYVVDFSGVVFAERMLRAEVPVDGIRILYSGRNPVSCAGKSRGLIQNGDSAAVARRQPSPSEKTGRKRSHIFSRADLRRHLQATDVVVKSVIGYPKTASNWGG